MFSQLSRSRRLLWLIILGISLMLAGCEADTNKHPGKQKAVSVESSQVRVEAENPAAGPDHMQSASVVPANNPTVKQPSVSPPAAKSETMVEVKNEADKSGSAVVTPKKIEISAMVNDEIVFSMTSFSITAGESVLAATTRAAADAGVKLEVKGMSFAAYVAGIGNWSEFDQGPMSGWLYRVNGQYPGTGCGMYKLQAGDQVEWIYTTDGKR